MVVDGNGGLSSLFRSKGNTVRTLSKEKPDLSAKVDSTDISPESIVTSPNFNLIDGVLVGAIEITPAIAKNWLERNVDNIRNPMSPSIGEYTEAMKKGQWDFNGDPIRFDKNGNLVDGQNRLLSCVESGKSFTSVVVYGIDSAVNIDIGRKRTLAQLLRHEGFNDDSQISATINYLHNYTYPDSNGFSQVGYGKNVLTKQDAIKFAETNALELRHSVNVTRKTNQLFNKWGVHSALHFLFSKTAGKTLADEFYGLLISGAGLAEKSPILHLRAKLNAERASASKKMGINPYAGLIIKGWNYWISGQEIVKLNYSYEKEKVAKIKRSPLSK